LCPCKARDRVLLAQSIHLHAICELQGVSLILQIGNSLVLFSELYSDDLPECWLAGLYKGVWY